jgi:hypothetical protein
MSGRLRYAGVLLLVTGLLGGCAALIPRPPINHPEPSIAALPTAGNLRRDDRFVPIDQLSLANDRQSLQLQFVGGKEFAIDDPCSIEYAARTVIADGALNVGVWKARTVPTASEVILCTLEGHSRSLDLVLEQPFDGNVWQDLAGYRRYLSAPPELAELEVPAGWTLLRQRDHGGIPSGLWQRVYAQEGSTATEDLLILYQSLGAQTRIGGGDEVTRPTVNGQPASLMRNPADGELLLQWMLEGDGLALVAYEKHFSTGELIDLAETAVPGLP